MLENLTADWSLLSHNNADVYRVSVGVLLKTDVLKNANQGHLYEVVFLISFLKIAEHKRLR